MNEVTKAIFAKINFTTENELLTAEAIKELEEVQDLPAFSKFVTDRFNHSFLDYKTPFAKLIKLIAMYRQEQLENTLLKYGESLSELANKIMSALKTIKDDKIQTKLNDIDLSKFKYKGRQLFTDKEIATINKKGLYHYSTLTFNEICELLTNELTSVLNAKITPPQITPTINQDLLKINNRVLNIMQGATR